MPSLKTTNMIGVILTASNVFVAIGCLAVERLKKYKHAFLRWFFKALVGCGLSVCQWVGYCLVSVCVCVCVCVCAPVG